MRKLMSAIVFFFLLGVFPPTILAATDEVVTPKQTIVGLEEEIPANEMAIVSVSNMKDIPKFLTKTTYAWKVMQDGKEKTRIIVWPDNTKLIFSVPDSSHRVVVLLVCTYLYEITDKDGKFIRADVRSSDILMAELKIKGPPVPPVPPPTPSFPDGKYKLSKFAYDNAFSKVLDQNYRVNGAAALSQSFKGVAAQIAAGVIKDPKEALTKVADANLANLSLKGLPTNCYGLWGDALKEYMYPLHVSGKLTTVEDFKIAWLEIALGLDAVK